MSSSFRAVRLRKHADYGLVYAASRKHRSTTLSYFYRVREAGQPRFGITVPRVLGPAVLRNFLKRRIRVIARAALHVLPLGSDVVLHPRPEAATVLFAALEREIEAVFSTIARRVAAGTDNTPLPRLPKRSKSKR